MKRGGIRGGGDCDGGIGEDAEGQKAARPQKVVLVRWFCGTAATACRPVPQSKFEERKLLVRLSGIRVEPEGGC